MVVHFLKTIVSERGRGILGMQCSHVPTANGILTEWPDIASGSGLDK